MAIVLIGTYLWNAHRITGVGLSAVIAALIAMNPFLRHYVTRNFPVATVTWDSLAGLARVARTYGWSLWCYALFSAAFTL